MTMPGPGGLPRVAVPFRLGQGVQRPDRAALAPLKAVYNDAAVSQQTRNALVRDYFQATLKPRLGIPAALTMLGGTGFPLERAGGIMGPLVKELRTSPALQKAVITASAEVSRQRPVEETWKTLVDTMGVDTTLKTLTMISGFYTWEEAEGIPEAVTDAAHDAYNKTSWINQQRSDDLRKGDKSAAAATHLPRTLVMNHGSSDAFDNNTHFFAHAWLAYRLQKLGFNETSALQTSAFAGAYYEMKREGSLDENHGNGAIKDILMNAQGSDFGIRLARDPRTPLPGAYDGLAAENKSL